MPFIRFLGGLAALALACLLLPACSGSSGGGGSLKIVSCTLGCSGSGAGGDGQVSCGIADVFVNGDLRITFSQPIDPATLTAFTFQVTDLQTGKSPSADRFVDPSNPAIVVYRPTLTFDSTGSPVFGLTQDQSYTLKVPGLVEDPGLDHVRSTSGARNTHRMLCTLDASLGVLDVKPGPPTLSAFVDVVTAYDPVTGEPSEFELGVPAQGAVDVYRFSRIELRFEDLMNPATLVNPITGTSTTLAVKVDPDGITTDASDQVDLAGSFSIQLDQDALVTRVYFEPAVGFPSAGSDPVNPRKIVVHLAPSISDLGGNPLQDPDPILFTPEVLVFPASDIEETFLDAFLEQPAATGADWGGTLPGFLTPGMGGGSGKHGDLAVAAGEVVTLSTDFEDFSGLTVAQWDPAAASTSTFDGSSFVVDPVVDGVFEFSSLTLSGGSVLRFVGSRPARVFVRGLADVRGLIDVSAEEGQEHSSLEVFGGGSAAPGPGGAPGGIGGRQPSWVNFESFPGVVIPEDPDVDPPTLEEIDGSPGFGIEDNLIAPSGTFGGGGPGIAWPQPTPTYPSFHFPVDPTDIGGMEYDLLLLCATKMKGSVGAGAGFGLNGQAGANNPMPGGLTLATEAPKGTPGMASDFGLGIGSDPELPPRKLAPEDGWLHGGAGGGGGGGHIVLTRTNGQVLTNCFFSSGSIPAEITLYGQHSSAGGGAGGGALQLQAGREAAVDGRLEAIGGSGGSKAQTLGNATAGGGGAGGAILLQAPKVQLGGAAGRLNVSGGEGGFGAGGSFGGAGGAGLIRVEQAGAPYDPSLLAVACAPGAAELANVGATPADIQSTGTFTQLLVGPSGVSGAQSCWLRPDGVYFTLEFEADDGADLGWDMSLIPNPASLGEQSFRGENDLFPAPLEDVFGNELGVSPIVVRFQGVRIVELADNPCAIALTGAESPVQPGSLTGWVDHPAQLNTYFADPGLRSNAVRFQILFDETVPSSAALQAVSRLWISVQPD